ncbi:hypothetical protein P7C70_g5336, partial [Phenoliferia sp. Uapishka_3]
MAAISSLPAETLLHILELVQPPVELGPPFDYDEVFAFSLFSLHSCALVSKAWARMATPMMWRNLHISSEIDMSLILRSPALGRFHTEELHIWVYGDGKPAWDDADWNGNMEALVDGLQGLEVLDVNRYPKSNGELHGPCDWIGSASLKDLKTLRIDMPFDEFAPETPRTKFQLSSFDIGSRFDSPTLIKYIFTSSSETLTCLTVDVDPSYAASSALLAAFPLIKDTLCSLDLSGRLLRIELHLPEFTVLENLKLTLMEHQLNSSSSDFLDTTFRTLPLSLSRLELCLQAPIGAIERHAFLLCEKLKMGQGGWERVTALDLATFSGDPYSYDGRRELEEACSARGVTLKGGKL